MDSSEETVMLTVGEELAGTTLDDVPDETHHELYRRMIDALGCAFAGHTMGTHREFTDRLSSTASASDATVVDTGTTSAGTAALANATAVHSTLQDDTHVTGVHPGSIIVPTALSVGETVAASGPDVLAAIHAGYDVIGRLGKPGSEILTGYSPNRSSSLLGPIAAAATASVLRQLDPTEFANALGLAANTSGGFSQVWISGTDEYAVQNGLAAKSGVLAADYAATGLTVAPRTFEGEYGFYESMFDDVDPSRVSGRGSRTDTFTDVFSKPYSGCAVTMSPIQLTRELRRDGVVRADVDEIEVTISEQGRAVPGVENFGPFETPTRALMSAPFSVAAALVLPDYSFDSIRENFDDPDVHEVIDDISLSGSEEYDKYQCRLRVRTTDGRTIDRQQRMVATMSTDDIEERFLTSASDVLDEDPSTVLAELRQYHSISDISTVMAKFR